MNEAELQHLFDTGRTNTPINDRQVDSVLIEATRRRHSRTIRRRAAITTLVLIAVTATAVRFQPGSSTEVVASETDVELTDPTITQTTQPDTTTPPTTTPPVPPSTTTNNPDLLESGLAPRGGHSVAWVDGNLFIWGGFSDETGTTQFTDGALFDRSDRRWTPTPASPLGPRWNHLTETQNQIVLIAGGNIGSFSETFTRQAALFDAAGMTWQTLDDAPFAIGSHTAREWINDDLFLVDPATGATARFNLETQTWTEVDALANQDLYDNVVLRSDGEQLFAFQGRCGAIAFSSLAPGSETWTLHEERSWRAPSANANGITHQFCLSSASITNGEISLWAEPEETGTAALTVNTNALQLEDQDPLLPSDGCHTSPIVQTFRSGATAKYDPCGSTEVFDPDQQQWFNAGPARGTADAVWTGDSVIVWGRSCCYGTGTTNSFTIEVDEFTAAELG